MADAASALYAEWLRRQSPNNLLAKTTQRLRAAQKTSVEQMEAAIQKVMQDVTHQ